MYRAQAYNEGRFHTLIPVSRIDVVPGQSIDLNAHVRMRSPNFRDPVLSGGLWTVASFYVPYRLMWDGWIDFVTERKGTGATVNETATVPASTVTWPFLFEKRTASANVWGRRAYKLIYNQFFGDKDMGERYVDFTDDADTAVHPVRSMEQLLTKLVMTGSITEKTYTIAVSGATGVIKLNELRHELELGRSYKRRDMSGNKYVDALLSMGVKLDWRVQQAPELLALHKGEFQASITAAQNKQVDPAQQTLGSFSSYYDAQCGHRTGRKFFAEHGTVLTVAVMRPHIFSEAATGSMFQHNTTLDNFFWGDNMDGLTKTVNGGMFGASAGSNAQLPRFSYFEYGENLLGRASYTNWVLSRGDIPASIDDVVYPQVNWAQTSPTFDGSSQLCAYAQIAADIKTPIGKGVHRL